MPQRLAGQLVDGGDPVSDEPVFVVDTGSDDESNWTIVATDRSAADGSWSATVPSADPERYHAVAQFEESGTLKNALSKPFLTSRPFAQPGLVTVGFDVLSPASVGTGRPTSVVTRTADNNTFSGQDGTFGLQIETNVEWPEIGAEISSNTTDATRAYIYRVSDSTLMGDADISDLTSGDEFTITLNNNLIDGETYNFVLDNEGGFWDAGNYTDPTYPITSSDGDLSIVNGASGETGTTSNVVSLRRVGNVGFE